jgi:hypothetical protein
MFIAKYEIMKLPSIAKNAAKVMEQRYSTVSLSMKTMVVIYDGQSDKIDTKNITIFNDKYAYISNYWKSQPDGEYILYLNQGGISNRDIPHVEKRNLKNFLYNPPLHRFIGEKFTGLVAIENANGLLTTITVNVNV